LSASLTTLPRSRAAAMRARSAYGEPLALERERVRLARLAYCRRPLDHTAVKVDEAPFGRGELPLADPVEERELERVTRVLG